MEINNRSKVDYFHPFGKVKNNSQQFLDPTQIIPERLIFVTVN